MSEFKFHFDVPVRFSDLDLLGHVNHVAYLDILENARIAYYYQVMGLQSPREIQFVMADLHIRYAASATLGQTIRVAFRMAWLKRSSSGFRFEMRNAATGGLLAEGDGVQVYMDLTTNAAQALPDDFRQHVERFEGGGLTPPG